MVLERQIDQACDPKEPNTKSLNFLNHVQDQVSLPVYISRVLCNYNFLWKAFLWKSIWVQKGRIKKNYGCIWFMLLHTIRL